MTNSNKVILVGAGPMAQGYAHVLTELGQSPIVVGRGADSAAKFRAETGMDVVQGGLDAFLASSPENVQGASVIVALPVAELADATLKLVSAGADRLLVEKPAGLNPSEVKTVVDGIGEKASDVFVAYNRRFVESVRHAKRLISGDGGAVSFRFEFAEFSTKVVELYADSPIRRNWFYANSTHVLDLAFYLGGEPTELHAQSTGGLDWHPEGASFVGHGRTDIGADFSYHADWRSSPRWMVDVYTARQVLILQPLEKLKVRPATGFAEEDVVLDNELDQRFKPGLYRQTRAFLTGEDADALVNLANHQRRMASIYAQILSGT